MTYFDSQLHDRTFAIGVLCGAVAASKAPGSPIDPSAVKAALTPAQLAVLDRALTPAEQKLVDDYQAAIADTMQLVEEKRVYTDPSTRQKRKAKVDYVASPGYSMTPFVDAPPIPSQQPSPPRYVVTRTDEGGWLSRKSAGVPNWGWLAIGGGAALFTTAVVLATRHGGR